MGENEKLTFGRVLQILLPAVGVTVAIISVLLSVAARKKELTCTLLNTTRLVSENLGGIDPDLRVEFKGQPLYSLSKMTFSLRNTGSAAIKGQDVSESVHLQFPSGARLLSAAVERTLPVKFAFSAKAVPQVGQVQVDFPLLNSGDDAVFSVYVLNSEPQSPSFEGRVVDVPQLIYTESASANGAASDWPHWSHATRRIVRWSLIVLYGLIGGAASVFWLYELFSQFRYMRWKPKWSESYSEVAKEVETRIREERDRQLQLDTEKLANMTPSEAETYLRGSLHRQVALIGPGRRLHAELKKKGIPLRPDPITDTFGDFLSFSLVVLGSAAISAVTMIVVHTALLG